MIQDKILKLKGKVQHYAWGGYEFIPKWLGEENTGHQPYAEYWMGAHPSASSILETQQGELPLLQLIQQQPEEAVGAATWQRFGELPYLFKILDVKEMLSIQVHPSKAEAEKGYDAEEAAGIPINAPHRNYKDRNHKPEVMVALSEFWLLHGFLQTDLLRKVLRTVPAFSDLASLFDREGYKGLYQHVMEMPQQQVNALLTPLVLAECQKFNAGQLNRSQPGWWVAKLCAGQKLLGNIDRGIFSVYFFNIVRVQAGEAVFQGAGVPHAYLEGQNVELMANSDNVLRGGLTPKHVDVPELLKHTVFEGITPVIMKGDEAGPGQRRYHCPVPDFGIAKIELQPGEKWNQVTDSLEIIVVMEGEVVITGNGGVTVSKGQAAAVLAGEPYVLEATQPLLAYRAFVPRLG